MDTMASLIQRILQFVTIFSICQHGSGLSLNAEIVPDTVNEIIDNDVTVTCLASDYSCWTQKVVIIDLGKKGQRPIAVLGRGKKDLELTSSLKTRMEASGQIDRNLTQSYLQIKIKSPVTEDSGTYICRLFYLDGLGKLKEETAEANLTVDNDNETPVYIHLLNRMLAYEKTVANLKDEMERQKEQLSVKESKLDLQEKLIEQVNDSTSEHQRKIDNQGKELKMIQNHLKLQDAQVPAFHVGYDSKDKVYAGRTILFSKHIMDIGNDYNNQTGIFTAPRTGLYVFHLTMTIITGKGSHIDLKANNKVMATLYIYDANTWDQTSSSCVVSLVTGDEVKPVLRSSTIDHLIDDDHHSVFTGYLLKPLE